MSAEDFANMVFDKIDVNGDGEAPGLSGCFPLNSKNNHNTETTTIAYTIVIQGSMGYVFAIYIVSIPF